MNRLHNKHGPARAICLNLTRHARDGIGSDSSARDGTILIVYNRMAEMLWKRSGRMPRDATIIAGFHRNIRLKWTKNHNLIFGRIRRKIRFRWRNMMPENRPSGPVQGEVCPYLNNGYNLYITDNESYMNCDLNNLFQKMPGRKMCLKLI